MYRNHINQFFSPIDLGGATPATPVKPLTSGDIESSLMDDSEDTDTEEITPDHELKLEEESEEEETEPESENEDSTEEEEPELDLEAEEDEVELARIPKRKEILAKYPDIFKNFPALDHIIHREHAFAEVFPTVSDAKSAKESVEQFNQFQSDLLSGNIDGVLSAVNKSDSGAFKKISENILESLLKVDPNAHVVTTQKITKGILSHLHNAAANALKKNPNDEYSEQIKIATELIHRELFNSPEVSPYAAQNREETREDPEKEKFKKDKEQFETSRFKGAFEQVSSKANTRLMKAVERDIDKNNQLTPYVRSNLVRDVMKALDEQLTSDTRLRGVVNRLWQKAKESDYSSDSLAKIQKALEEAAKPILPAIMRAKKGEAIKGLSSVKRKEQPEIVKGSNNRAPQKLTSNRSENDRNLPRPGEKAIDFLMRD